MTLKQIWEVLNAGNRITDGEHIITYRAGMLFKEDDGNGEGLDLIPFNEDNAEDWVKVDEKAALLPLYYRWIFITEDESMIQITAEWYREDIGITTGFKRHGEGFTKDEIVNAL